MDKLVLVIVLALGTAILPLKGSAQTDEIDDYIEGKYITVIEQLYKGMHDQVAMCRTANDEVTYYHKFCRSDKLCLPSLKLYAKYIVRYAIEYDLDVWLLAAVALHETNFDAYRVGAIKERGIFQLNPRAWWGYMTPFVKDRRYRKACKTREGHCQHEVVGMAAWLIRAHVDQTKSLESALTLYNTGHKYPIRKTYVNGVMSKRQALIEGRDIPKCN